MDRRDFLKTTGWTALGLAASGSIIGCSGGQTIEAGKRLPADVRKRLQELRGKKVLWGDLHNHCAVTYGHGRLCDAIDAAREQLDFCSVTPHALWPDIPGAGDPRLEWVIDYHTQAFKRLREGGWEKYVQAMERANEPGKFLTFTSYECHSMAHGDHVALCRDYDVPLLEAESVPDLKEKLRPYRTYVTPHHMGYMTGYRGYNWAAFVDGDEQTPFVELYSRHGNAETDMGDYDYLHDMGPRIYEGSVQYGLEQGHKFGIMCSTDQHAGYPGSYGDGRIGVLADSLDKDAIWEQLGKRHHYGVTGDKIKLDFSINGCTMGDEITASGTRKVLVAVEAQNYIDYVDVIRNGRCIARLDGPFTAAMPQGEKIRAKVKINFGWNREEEYVHWTGQVRVDGGEILDYQTCFRGAAFTSPQPGEKEFIARVNRVTGSDANHVDLDLYSSKNPNTTTPAQQGIILDVLMSPQGTITADVNGQQFTYTLEELFQGTKAHFMRGWLSEAVQFERACPEDAFSIGTLIEDKEAERDTDYYYVRVRQRDGQWAWSSPIWVNSK